MATFGRKKIITTYKEINENNIADVLAKSYSIHLENLTAINNLYNYYRGNQEILSRVKAVRSDHNAKIVENHAFEIANFIAGYLLAKPIQYIANGDVNVDKLAKYNAYVVNTLKESQDMVLAKDRSICGTGYRISLPLDDVNQPFEAYVLSPKNTFVVYGSSIGNKALIGCTYHAETNKNNVEEIIIEAYTKDYYYKFNNTTSVLVDKKPHTMGEIPIIEYPLNEERIGSFEPVITMLDAINLIDSDRVNAITQFVQAFLVFKNVEVNEKLVKDLKDLGAIQIADNGEIQASVSYITQELNQSQVQTFKDDMLQTIYKIVGMPQQNSGGGGDNGIAVIYKDGWTEVEAKMRPNELAFKDSERQFLKLSLAFTKTMTKGKVDLDPSLIEIKFTRSNYENIAQKVDAFVKLMSLNNIDPLLAYQVVGLFSDPEQAYQKSQKFIKGNPVTENEKGTENK